MQLRRQDDIPAKRFKLHRAACALLSASATAAAASDGAGSLQIDAASLLYAESGRTTVVEPVVRIKKLFRNGQSLALRGVYDSMTGASPNGALPTNRVQTFTTPSGNTFQVPVGETPLRSFQDNRFSIDAEYERPLHRMLTGVLGAHRSLETDYSSTGVRSTVNWDLQQRLTTLSLGVGANSDRITPQGGKPAGLDYSWSPTRDGSFGKRIVDGMIGVSRVLSRRWMARLNFSRSQEKGYLTEPYKLVGVIDGNSGFTYDYRNEKRPDNRARQSVFLSSVYQRHEDVVHFSYRFYWDDWGLRSQTVDVRYFIELPKRMSIEPHLRYYMQNSADFFSCGIPQGEPLPEYASSDYRLGYLTTVTAGARWGFTLSRIGEMSFKLEYLRQGGRHHPSSARGVQRDYDLFPVVNTVIATVGYATSLR